MLIKPIIAKNALTRRKPYMIQELFHIVNLFPSLTLNYNSIFYCDQLHILVASLLTIQIFHIVAINLDRRYFQMILLAALLIQPLYLCEYKLSCPW